MTPEEQQAWLDLEAAEVDFVLERAGLDRLFIKGNFVDEVLGVSSRAPSVDVDVIVQDGEAAVRALVSHGYRDVLSGMRRVEVASHSYVCRRGTGPEIDVHVGFVGVRDRKGLWDALGSGRRLVERAGRLLPTPGADGHRLLLALTVAAEGPTTRAASKLEERVLHVGSAVRTLAEQAGARDGVETAFHVLRGGDWAAPALSRQIGSRLAAEPWHRRPLLLLSEAFPSRAFLRAQSRELGGGSLPVLWLKRLAVRLRAWLQ